MTVDLPLPALVQLDQAPLSEMAKNAAYAKDLRAFWSSENAALALDFSHAQATAQSTLEDRQRLLQEIDETSTTIELSDECWVQNTGIS